MRHLAVVTLLFAVRAWAECTPFDLAPENAGAQHGVMPDGGPSPDSTICCESGVGCDHRCPNCTQVGQPVDTLSGFAWLDRVDLDLVQPWGPPVRFARHYSTATAERGLGSALGTGWTHTYSSALSLSGGGTPAGRVSLFVGEDAGELYVFDGTRYSTFRGGRTLRWDSATQSYLASRGDGSTLVFDNVGRLRVIRAADGGEAYVRYAGDDATCAVSSTLPASALCRVDFLFDRQLWFSYLPTGSLESVSAVQGSSPIETFSYFSNGSLQVATATDGNGETYTYGFTHISWVAGVEVSLLTEARDADGKIAESFSYRFNRGASEGPPRVASHATPESTYTFSWEYLDLTSRTVVRRTHVRSNHENLDLTFGNNIVTSACFLDAAGHCDITRLHTYVQAPGSFDVQCEQEGSGKFLRHERDALGRVTAEYRGLSRCDTVTPQAQNRAETLAYLGDTSLKTSTSRVSLDPTAPAGTLTFSVADYTSPSSAIDAYCGTASCQTPTAYNTSPLATRVQREVVVGHTLLDTEGHWGAQVQVTAFGFDSSGRRTTVDGPRRDVADLSKWTWSASPAWAVESVTPAGRSKTTYANYDERGNATEVVNGAGAGGRYEYDRVGRVISARPPGVDGPLLWTYLPSGRIDTNTLTTGATRAYTYDADGQVKTERKLSDLGSTVPEMERAYTRTLKRVTQIMDSESHPNSGIALPVRTVQFGYDGQGRRTRTISPGPSGGSAVGIDDDDRVVWRSDEGHFNAFDTTPVQSHRYTYDDFGQVIQVQQLVAANWVTTSTYTWDLHGNLATVTDAKGVTTRYQHDDFDRLVEVESPDFGLRRYVHDEAGNLVKERRGDGAVFEYQYDAANRLVQVRRASASIETYDWNAVPTTVTNCAGGQPLPQSLAVDQLTHVHDAVGDWYFGYWADGRVRFEALVADGARCAKTFQWDYDPIGALVRMTYPSGATIQFDYPNAVREFRDQPRGVLLFAGDPNGTPMLTDLVWSVGELVGYATPSRARWSLTRELDGTPRRLTAANSNLREQSFNQFDGWGNPNQLQESLWQKRTAAQLHTFSHSDLPALTSATGPGYAPQQYSYLVSGDRKSANGHAYCYEAGSHRLALVEGTSRFTYSAEGAVQRRLDRTGAISTWCYGPRGELTSTVGAGGEVNRVTTNHRRHRSIEWWPVNGLREDFRFDERGRLLVEAGVGSLSAQYPRPTREYVWLGDHPVAVIESTEAADGTVTQTGVTYLYSGQLGEVLLETAAEGTLLRQYTYTPFGARQEVGGPSEEQASKLSLNSLPGFDNLWGTVSGVTGARAVRLRFTDASMAGCDVIIRADDFRWLAEISSVQTGAQTAWLPAGKLTLEVKKCTAPGSPWQPTLGLTSDVASFTTTAHTEATSNPYPAAGQHFSVTLAQPGYLQVEGVALASCDQLEARDQAGTTLWSWKPGSYSVSGFMVPDDKAVTSRLTGTIDFGVWGSGCNATEAKPGFKITKVFNEVGGPTRPPSAMGYPGQTFRYDGSVDNWFRQYDPQLGSYLAPEPLLLNPRAVVDQAMMGSNLPVHAYANNSPLRLTDPTGLYTADKDCKLSMAPSMQSEVRTRAKQVEGDCLRDCVVKRVNEIHFECTTKFAKKACTDTRLAAATLGTSCSNPETQAAWCNRTCSDEAIVQAIVHEAAHNCGWNHNGGKNVPGDDGHVSCATKKAEVDIVLP